MVLQKSRLGINFNARIMDHYDSNTKLEDTIDRAWEEFKKVVMEAATSSIRRGRRYSPKIWWNERGEELTEKWKQLRTEAKHKPEAKAEYNAVSRQSDKEICEMRRDTWRSYGLDKLNPRTKPSLVFKTMNSIDGRGKSNHPTTPLVSGDRILRTDEAKADAFVQE